MYKALIAGSFDPVTVGHLDMIRRASRLCKDLTVGVFRNYSKPGMFTVEQRIEMLRACTKDLPNVTVTSFEGHLANYVLANGYDAVIRGLRSGMDFEYELQLSQIYESFYKGRVETLYIMTSPQYSFVTSSVVRENFMLKADVSDWVPDGVLELMNQYYKGESK
ncbi:MAG: pantetheine-phosphate adenylyltransferase [Firmicutes bacterium]|nr:pantetheine-phosphate adenylyltransferase [Bacillota bacterium]